MFPNKKEQAKQDLEFICRGVMHEYHTLTTDFMNLNYWIRKQIQLCYERGVTVKEVDDIINRFKGA